MKAAMVREREQIFLSAKMERTEIDLSIYIIDSDMFVCLHNDISTRWV